MIIVLFFVAAITSSLLTVFRFNFRVTNSDKKTIERKYFAFLEKKEKSVSC